jgi:hypothetical protein
MSTIDPKLPANLLLIASNPINIVAIYKDRNINEYYMYFMGKPYSCNDRTGIIKQYNKFVPPDYQIKSD